MPRNSEIGTNLFKFPIWMNNWRISIIIFAFSCAFLSQKELIQARLNLDLLFLYKKKVFFFFFLEFSILEIITIGLCFYFLIFKFILGFLYILKLHSIKPDY